MVSSFRSIGVHSLTARPFMQSHRRSDVHRGHWQSAAHQRRLTSSISGRARRRQGQRSDLAARAPLHAPVRRRRKVEIGGSGINNQLAVRIATLTTQPSLNAT